MQVPPEFKDLDLYEVLQISPDSDDVQIKKAYRRRALTTHPDKVGDSPENQLQFQQVAFAYSVLSDPTRRESYDEYGTVVDVEDASLAGLFTKYFRKEFTEEMIEQDKNEYRESGEEHSDLLRYYKEYQGDFDRVLEAVLHTEVGDQARLIAELQVAIDEGTVPKYAKFAKTTSASKNKKREKKGGKEAKEAEKLRKKLNIRKTNDENDLAALIKARSAQRFNGFMDRLEAKYRVSKPRSK